jgi:DME family drug/metabolite transporter
MSSQHSSRRGFWFVVCASVLWGTAGVVTQAIYTQSATTTLSLAFLRLAIAAPLFFCVSWLLRDKRILHIKRRDLGIMLLMGAMQALYQASYIAAITYTGVTVSTLIAICGAPVIIALVTVFIAKERLTAITLVALVCALAGTMLLVSPRPHTSQTTISMLGVLLALLSAGGYATYILCGRLLTSYYHPLHINAVAFGTGALLLLPVLVVSPGGLILTYPTESWLLLIYLGCIPTAFAYALFQAGIRSLTATIASILTLCEPLTTAVLAWIFFHEELGLPGLLGALLLLGAMLLLMRKQ